MAFRDSSQLITIGEFARLGGVSIKALRLYANLGLLPPAVVKPQSRYRLYSRVQLSRLHRILLLKNAGLALGGIGSELSQRDQAALTKIHESLLSRAQEIQRQLAWVEAEIRAARNGTESVAPRVVLKRIPKMKVMSQRERIESYDQADGMLQELGKVIPRPARLISGAIWHDCGRRTRIIDCEAFWVLNRTVRTTHVSNELPPATMASILHEGDESAVDASYEIARRWIRDNQFKISGPNREIYLAHTVSDPSATMIEIQFPIEE